MRIILLSLLALAACSEPSPPVADAVVATTDAVVAAERGFAGEASERGWVEAYETWADDAGVVISSGVQNAKAFAANIHPDVRGDTSLRWAPEFAGISAAGDFGFTAGPFNGDDAAFGHYVTVWRKTETGEWRWLLEGGVDVLTPTQPDLAGAVAAASAPEAAEGSADAAIEAVMQAEAALAAAAEQDATGALSARMADAARVQRADMAPATGAAIADALKAGPARIAYRNLSAQASAAGDMAFTLGEARWDGGSGHYVRVWVRGASDWRIVFDQIEEGALPPA